MCKLHNLEKGMYNYVIILINMMIVINQAHPLRLLGSIESWTCAIYRGACNASSWRYKCTLCGFDIHIDCVPIQCEKREIPYNWHHNYMPQPQHQNHGQAQARHGGGGRIGRVMFDLVKTLGTGVLSNMIFGSDLSLFFTAWCIWFHFSLRYIKCSKRNQ